MFLICFYCYKIIFNIHFGKQYTIESIKSLICLRNLIILLEKSCSTNYALFPLYPLG